MHEIFIFPIVAGVLAGIFSGIVSIYALMKRLTLLSDSISHAAFAGILLGLSINVNPIFSGILYSSINLFIIKFMIEKLRISEDLSIASTLSFNFSISILVISLKGISPSLVFSYIFGNILLIDIYDLITIITIFLLILLISIKYRKEILLITVNTEYSKVLISNYNLVNILIYILIMLTIFSLIKIVGIVLTIALISLPGFIAYLLSNSFYSSILISSFVSVVSILFGILISFVFNLPTSPTIVMTLIFIASILVALKYLRKD